MSEATSAVADAMANAVDVSKQEAPAAVENSAPQAVETAVEPAETPAPSASAEEPTDAAPNDATETPSRAEKRIQQLLQREREARERIAYLEGLTQRQEPPKQAEPMAPAQLPQDLAKWVGDEPKPEAFPAGEFDPQYLRAIARFEAKNEQAMMVAAQREYAQRQQAETRAKSFAEEAAKVEKEKPDLREVVGGLGHRLQNWQADLLAEAGIEVAYHVGKDAEAEARIRDARSPVAVAREIGRIEARLAVAKEASAAAAVAPTPQPSAAPAPPPKAVRGGSGAGFDWSKASVADIQARINAR